MDPNGNVLRSYILALSPTEVLEGEQLLGLQVESDCLTVDDKRLGVRLYALRVRRVEPGNSPLESARPNQDTLHSCSQSYD